MKEDEKNEAQNTVELIVAYEADGARAFARIHNDGELVEFSVGGQVMDPPAPTLVGIYCWLGTNGYVPDTGQFKWLDRHAGRRRRRQVYLHQPREKIPEQRLTHTQAWNLDRGYSYSEL